jgi:hypothetical protein
VSKEAEHNAAIAFKLGEFLHIRKSVPGMVGVAGQIRTSRLMSVEVYVFARTNSRVADSYEPRQLEHVNADEVPPYAVELKVSLGI